MNGEAEVLASLRGVHKRYGTQTALDGVDLELRAGQVLSGRDGSVMALLRLDRLDGDLTVDGRRVSVRRPAWLLTEA